jgi:hypothetical protein
MCRSGSSYARPYQRGRVRGLHAGGGGVDARSASRGRRAHERGANGGSAGPRVRVEPVGCASQSGRRPRGRRGRRTPSSRANSGPTAAKSGGDGGGRLHTKVGDQVVVVVGRPGRPALVVELDAGCRPGGPEAWEVAEHRVLRRIVPRVLTQASDQAGSVAAGGRRPAGCSVEGKQTRQHALAGPPGAFSVRSSAKRPLMWGPAHWSPCMRVRVGIGDPARSSSTYQQQVIGAYAGRAATAAPHSSTVRYRTDVQLPGDLCRGHPPNTALFPHGRDAGSVGRVQSGPQPAGRRPGDISPEAFGQRLVSSRQARGAGATARPPRADGGVPHSGDERIAAGLADSLELSHHPCHGARRPAACGGRGDPGPSRS